MDDVLAACRPLANASPTDSAAACHHRFSLALALHAVVAGAPPSPVTARHVKAIAGAAAATLRAMSPASGGTSPLLLQLQRNCAALTAAATVLAASHHARAREREGGATTGSSGKPSTAAAESREAMSAAYKAVQEQLLAAGTFTTTASVGNGLEALTTLVAVQSAFSGLPGVFRRAAPECAAACFRWGARFPDARAAATAALAAIVTCLALPRKGTGQGSAASAEDGGGSGAAAAATGAAAPAPFAAFLLASVDGHVGALRALTAGIPVSVPSDDDLARALCGAAGTAPTAGGSLEDGPRGAAALAVVEARLELMLGALRGVALQWTPLSGAGAAVPEASRSGPAFFPVPAALAVVAVMCDVAGLRSLGVTPTGSSRIAGASLSLLEGVVELLGARTLRFRAHLLRCVATAVECPAAPLTLRLQGCTLLAVLARAGGLGLDGPEVTQCLRTVVRFAAHVLVPPVGDAGGPPAAAVENMVAACAVLHEVVACRGELLPDALRLAIERTALTFVDRGCGMAGDVVGSGGAASEAGTSFIGMDTEESGQPQPHAPRSKNARYFNAPGKAGQAAASAATAGSATGPARQAASLTRAPLGGVSSGRAMLALAVPAAPALPAFPPSVAAALGGLLVQCAVTLWHSGSRSPLGWELQAAQFRVGLRGGSYVAAPPSLLEYGRDTAGVVAATTEAEAARIVTLQGASGGAGCGAGAMEGLSAHSSVFTEKTGGAAAVAAEQPAGMDVVVGDGEEAAAVVGGATAAAAAAAWGSSFSSNIVAAPVEASSSHAVPAAQPPHSVVIVAAVSAAADNDDFPDIV